MVVFLVEGYYTHLKCCSFYGGAGRIKWIFEGFDVKWILLNGYGIK